jgi:uncharacterized lipoprotein YmbA
MTVRKHLLTLACALSLGACSSTPTHYYTLIAPTTQAPATTAQAPFQFEMQPVLMAVQVDQPPLVVRQGDGSLAILENERWGAPLGDEFHDALTGELERRFGSRDLAGLRNSGAERQTLTCSSVIRQPAGVGMESLVLAHQKAVSSLADVIARTANEWARQPTSHCPS